MADYLGKEAMLSHWRMPSHPYDETRDKAALELYARYNSTPNGIRLLSQRKVYLFRRTDVQQYPAIPAAKPLY